MTLQFDTLAYVKRLIEAVEKPEIAEAHACTLRDFVVDNLATRDDLKAAEASLGSEMKATEASLGSDIKALQAATKAGFAATEERLRSEMKVMETSLRTDIALVRKDLDAQTLKLTVRMGGIMVVMAGMFATLVKLL